MRKGSKIPMGRVIRDVLFEEHYFVPAQAQRANEATPQGGVAIAPRRAESEPENDNFHMIGGANVAPVVITLVLEHRIVQSVFYRCSKISHHASILQSCAPTTSVAVSDGS